ncbi:MAG: DUF2726 domain-containing protein [Burkholderiales bacterium]|nr:DUF2726 domain-containing protein [Burkholderiales bacterium]
MPSTLPWIIALGASTLLLVLLAAWAYRSRRRRPKPLPTHWELSARPVFSTEERRVYRHLREALPHHIVLAKVPLVRFSQSIDPQRRGYWYALLGTIHVTFAVCSPNGRVLVAFDLLDEAIPGSLRQQTIKENVMAACKVRYLRIPGDDPPSVAELQLLLPAAHGASRAPNPAPGPGLAPSPSAAPGPSRRRDRGALWQDSGFFQDSFFGPERREPGTAGEHGALSHILRDGFPRRDDDEPPPGDPSVSGAVPQSRSTRR